MASIPRKTAQWQPPPARLEGDRLLKEAAAASNRFKTAGDMLEEQRANAPKAFASPVPGVSPEMPDYVPSDLGALREKLVEVAKDVEEIKHRPAMGGAVYRRARVSEAAVRNAILIDEDDFASNSDQEAPTQQSTKAYVDGAIADRAVHKYADRAAVAAATVPADTDNIAIEAYSATVNPSAGRANYRAASDAEYAVVPAALRLTDATGRKFVINEPAIHVSMAGAVGDGVTDDTAAINAALAYMRTMIHSTTESRKFSVQAHGMSCLALGSIDATMIRGQKRWAIEGLILHSKAAGKAAIDCTGSRFGLFRDCIIWGDVTSTPYSGIQFCRYNAGGGLYPSAGEHLLDNVVVDGYYTKTSYHNYSSEVNTHIACRFWNRYSGGYAIILDGGATHPVVSDFVTPLTVSLSALEHMFVQADVRQLTSGPAIFIGRSDHVNFLNSYGVSIDDVIVEALIGTFDPTLWTFDMHMEVTPNATAFMRIDSTDANVAIKGLIYKDNNPHAADQLFEVTANVTTLAIYDLDVHIGDWAFGPGPTNGAFDTPSKVTLRNANIKVPTLAGFLGPHLLADFAGFTGSIHARDFAENFVNGDTHYSDSGAADATTARALVDYFRGGADTNGDVLHTLRFYGKDSAGNKFQYAGIKPFISNSANGSEAGSLDLVTSNAGVSLTGFRVGPSMNTAFIPIQLPTYTVAGLAGAPASVLTRCQIFVSNETGGPTVAYSDGTNWRRVYDNAVVS